MQAQAAGRGELSSVGGSELGEASLAMVLLKALTLDPNLTKAAHDTNAQLSLLTAKGWALENHVSGINRWTRDNKKNVFSDSREIMPSARLQRYRSSYAFTSLDSNPPPPPPPPPPARLKTCPCAQTQAASDTVLAAGCTPPRHVAPTSACAVCRCPDLPPPPPSPAAR